MGVVGGGWGSGRRLRAVGEAGKRTFNLKQTVKSGAGPCRKEVLCYFWGGWQRPAQVATKQLCEQRNSRAPQACDWGEVLKPLWYIFPFDLFLRYDQLFVVQRKNVLKELRGLRVERGLRVDRPGRELFRWKAHSIGSQKKNSAPNLRLSCAIRAIPK